jgi:hypothetical protein
MIPRAHVSLLPRSARHLGGGCSMTVAASFGGMA